MNYYPPNHPHMSSETPFLPFGHHFPNALNFSTNRFIYVKHNFINPNPNPTPKVLVNPHFKKKVYVNPQFKLPETISAPLNKPKIHVNPNILKNFVPKAEPKSSNDSKTTVISTRNKLVRIPCNTTTEKIVKKRRNSIHTKYKIVRFSGAKNIPLNKSKYKFDKRNVGNVVAKSVRKKYVYVNRFLSMDVMAKNVLLKKNLNLCKPGFVNINGILYKKSPNSLKKAMDASKVTLKSRVKTPVKPSNRYRLVRKEQKRTPSSSNRRSLVKRYKLIRSKVKTPSKLKKCNIPCPIYRKYGKCPGKIAGTCIKLHNPDQIVLCTRFLQGACRDEKCLLSHKVSHEKMPTCKYFLEGMCSKDDCPYLHVKISPKADICRDFLEGFCKRGAECDKRHQFLCPDFEKSKKCPKRRCPYPHGNTVRKCKVNTLAKKCSVKKEKKKRVVEKLVKDVIEKNRYYKDLTEKSGSNGSVINTVSKDRPKLGELPAFIPFFDAT